ncbi:alpha/beta-hydrolase family protein [Actinoplanes sp. NPDC024001]|uniref:alpha/beta-hydrolase family protein n=1 Tax=Actinoplanes sp. NPDC024001 TaxID=3154598 RepID=UPI0033E2FEF7
MPDSAANVGLLVASALAPETFESSLSPRSAGDQGLVTGLSIGMHYLLTVSTHEALRGIARWLSADGDSGRLAAPQVPATLLADVVAIPAGLAIQHAIAPRAGEPMARGLLRQLGWRTAVTGLGGVLLTGAQAGTRWVDTRIGAGGRIAVLPVAVPAGLGVAYLLERRRVRTSERPGTADPPSALRSLSVAGSVVAGMSAAAYAEHLLTDQFGRRMAAALPGPVEVWRLLGHGAFLLALGVGGSALWHRAMRRIEADTSADQPVFAADEATRWVAPTISGGPGSLVSWASLGREGRRHGLAYVRPAPVPDAPAGTPDLSIETVMGQPARAQPVQVYVGLDSAPTARERVDLALAELNRTGAFRRSLLMLVSPTGTGYVNYVAVAAAQYLALGDVATVTMQYSKRPSPLSLGMVKAAREQNRLLWLRILQEVGRRPEPRPRVVLFGESLGAHTSQDVFLHWGTLGLEALGIDRALWIGTPYGSGWMHQVTGADRLDVDRDTIAVVNDYAQLAAIAPQRRARLRYVMLSHDNDGVTKFGLDLLATPPRWLGADRPRPEDVEGTSPRGIPPGIRWRPITTFFQLLIDMKNAQVPGRYRAWGHDYRPDLARFISEVYALPATPEQLDRIETALKSREVQRERLFEHRATGR